ncbi:unnamed protein product [Psylliodes chrysocephalus]|uniref:Uncharacterized protein n=1 Tax=Psylliodes chrysocephalus TaxID=3402493 RepID=A0A9P0D4G4_9CUCU|nr:unnamed protein product [Psylliodes chrysocephala]
MSDSFFSLVDHRKTKRFSDWKHTTRFKYRKYLVNKNKTEGGPEVKTPLTSLEERAINAWGKVVVEDFNIENIEIVLEDNAQPPIVPETPTIKIPLREILLENNVQQPVVPKTSGIKRPLQKR